MTEYLRALPAGPLSARAAAIEPFHVMALLAQAQALERQGRDIIHMEVGEPDFGTPAPIIAAASRFLAGGQVRYTPAPGLEALRDAISGHYQTRFGLRVDPRRVIVTAGASGALLLAIAALTQPGDRWLVPDPGYPCNRHFVRAFEGVPVPLPVSSAGNFQPTAPDLSAAWTPGTRGVIVASPANPTGSVIDPAALAALHQIVRARQGALLVDEIYQGLSYGRPPCSALALGDELFVINSFSKYFGMTGWRLGWLIAPDVYVPAIERLAQHFFISACAVSQHAALAAFEAGTRDTLEQRRATFEQRRNTLLSGLRALGMHVPATPEGAFYVYADVSALTDDSEALARMLLERAGVACTPGRDFGHCAPERWLRFAYTVDAVRIDEAVERIGRAIRQC